MSDITERLRDLARDNGYRGIGEYWNACEEAADEICQLRARVAELEAERADDDALRERMSDILKRTAIALRGPEPPLTAWSWHDLPERAAAAIASIDLFQRVAHNLADTPAKDGVELIDGCDCTCSVVQSAHGHHAGCPAKDGTP